MTNDGRITDELREWMNDNYPAWRKLRTGVSTQLDHIDVAHEKAIQREHESAYDMGYAEGSGAGLATVALGSARWLDEHEDEMVKHGFVHLPKDADGEYIHIGDVLDNTHKDGFTAKSVIGISYREDETYVRVDEDKLRWHIAGKLCHHKQPTVEDTLHELISKAIMLSEVDGENKLVAEYAAKLRLVGDEE